LPDRVISLLQFVVSGGRSKQQDDIEPLGVSFKQRLPGLPVNVDAFAITLAPFVEDENLFALTPGGVQRGLEQIGTVIQGIVDIVPVTDDQSGNLACPPC
jgi:hypothetical protein